MTEKHRVRARIYWLPSSRRTAPGGNGYLAPARFEDELEEGPGHWSLIVWFLTPPQLGRWNEAEIEYLVDDAPHQLLRYGAAFQLHEGREEVALGVVIDDGEPHPGTDPNFLELMRRIRETRTRER